MMRVFNSEFKLRMEYYLIRLLSGNTTYVLSSVLSPQLMVTHPLVGMSLVPSPRALTANFGVT